MSSCPGLLTVVCLQSSNVVALSAFPPMMRLAPEDVADAGAMITWLMWCFLHTVALYVSFCCSNGLYLHQVFVVLLVGRVFHLT